MSNLYAYMHILVLIQNDRFNFVLVDTEVYYTQNTLYAVSNGGARAAPAHVEGAQRGLREHRMDF